MLSMNALSIPVGPTWTDLFISNDVTGTSGAPGTDGPGSIGAFLVECDSGTVEVQVDTIHGFESGGSGMIFTAGKQRTFVGKSARIGAIKRVRARGNGGAAVISGGVVAR